ncbi:efflux RND transporter periplasmic adaptor subunit [Amaricoccus sp.]|uniref:HlyD family secretion protein n=1 Tax=Amaricoccus sp. TaxID=1872485 RepID=UPI002609EA0A|nr:efflux RND transporter periplasmic adaptor subunit [Amaricoccus sp.]HRO12699.1 efflux RND transporter periplasmic adaptor subunit [Amaricoccus sp.]
MAEEDAAPGSGPAAPEKPDPVRRWTGLVAGALVLLLVLQIASDRTAPLTTIATVEALVLPIVPRVSGELVRVEVRDDATVEPGEVLAEIDPTPFRLAAEAAEAELARAGQAIGASTAEVAAAQAKLAEAQAHLTNSRAQADRTLALVERGVVPAARGDEAVAAIAGGEALVAAAEADLRRAEQALGPAGADNPQLRAAQSALETAQFNLAQTLIVSPAHGRVTNLSLGAGETASAGQPILTMIDLQGGWIVAWFRENQLGNIARGDRAEVVLDVQPGRVWQARVVSFIAGIDTVNQSAPRGGLIDTPPQARWLSEPQRFAVRLEFTPSDSLPPGVRLGSQATVMVETAQSAWLRPLWWAYIRVRAILSYVR